MSDVDTLTNTIYIHQPEKTLSFTQFLNFLFEAPPNEAKVLYTSVENAGGNTKTVQHRFFQNL